MVKRIEDLIVEGRYEDIARYAFDQLPKEIKPSLKKIKRINASANNHVTISLKSFEETKMQTPEGTAGKVRIVTKENYISTALSFKYKEIEYQIVSEKIPKITYECE